MDKEFSKKEKIILGIDPGTNIMGYSIVVAKKEGLNVLQFGVIHLGKIASYETRLYRIFHRICTIIDEFNPDEMALEAPFYGKNVQSMLKLGRAQGVAMAAALHREIPIFEYAPRKVKQSVTGNGNASKEQISKMLITLFSLSVTPKFTDATDALAVAVCHHHQGKTSTKKKTSWESFVKENEKRVHS